MRPLARRLRRPGSRPPNPVPGLFSVIMPVRDRAPLVPRAVASVLAQSYRRWELIVVDDGSRDGLRRALAPFRRDPRLRLLRQAPKGSAAARNTGLAAARGALVAYLDSDNEWLPDHLAMMAQALAPHGTRSAYGIATVDDGTRRFAPFDRQALLTANYIDLNAFAHRRDDALRFDETLRRLVDWDFILRMTEAGPAAAVPEPVVRYRQDAPARITRAEDFIAPLLRIRRRWAAPAPVPARPPRILYALWHYPQGSEMYVETELRALRRRGAEIEVWSEAGVSMPYATEVTVHRGNLGQAIAMARPDIVHTHWLNMARRFAPAVAAAGLPYTVRAHGFEATPDALAAVLADPAVRRVYAYRNQAPAGQAAPKLRLIDNAFETALFRPGAQRDRALVVRAAAALPSKDLGLFLALSKRLPAHRFVLAIAAAAQAEDHVGALLALRREMDAPVDIRVNLPHAEVAALMGRAGIYLHTVALPGAEPGTPLGQPTSIAEAMASGCLVLHHQHPDFASYAGPAGRAYADEDEAAALIAETAGWDDAAWARAQAASVERGWTFYAGDAAFDALYRDWVELAGL